MSVKRRVNVKLEPKYFGSFQVVDKIGPVAYKLSFLETFRIHPILHVSQLRAFVGTLPTQLKAPTQYTQACLSCATSCAISLVKKLVKRRNVEVVQYLVQWEGITEDQASW